MIVYILRKVVYKISNIILPSSYERHYGSVLRRFYEVNVYFVRLGLSTLSSNHRSYSKKNCLIVFPLQKN